MSILIKKDGIEVCISLLGYTFDVCGDKIVDIDAQYKLAESRSDLKTYNSAKYLAAWSLHHNEFDKIINT